MRLFGVLLLVSLALGVAFFVMRGEEISLPDVAQLYSDGANEITIETFHLSNGLEVILLPNHRVPAVSVMTWLRVGAADDPLGKSGLAHYHEHLMFKGTPSVPDGEFTKRLEALGGEFNAFTSQDFTGYYINIAREHLDVAMQIEADRMQHLQPEGDAYATELDVIVEERQSRIGSRPVAQWGEQMRAAMFLHHPYRVPVIGWMHEIKGLSPEDAKRFYEDHYHAGNMVLIVAGDVTRDALEPLAEATFGTLPKGQTPQRDWVQEPPAKAARTVTLRHAEVRQPRFERRYRAASYGHGEREQVLPLALFAQWLGGGKTSLLYQALVEEQQLAVAVRASYSGFNLGPDEFTIAATPSEGVAIEALEAAIDAVLTDALSRKVGPEDLKRIQTLFKASAIYARDGLSPLAHYAGYLSMLGLPMSYLSEWEALVEAVTPVQMRRAASATLIPERSVTGYLLPALAAEQGAVQ